MYMFLFSHSRKSIPSLRKSLPATLLPKGNIVILPEVLVFTKNQPREGKSLYHPEHPKVSRCVETQTKLASLGL